MRTEKEIRKQIDAVCSSKDKGTYDYTMGYISALRFALGEEGPKK